MNKILIVVLSAMVCILWLRVEALEDRTDQLKAFHEASHKAQVEVLRVHSDSINMITKLLQKNIKQEAIVKSNWRTS